MTPVVWTLPALAHLDAIQDYVAQDSPKAAYRLVNRLIDRTEKLLAANPMSGRAGRVASTRELVLPAMPYIVVYRVVAKVEIVAVVHAARDWPDEFI